MPPVVNYQLLAGSGAALDVDELLKTVTINAAGPYDSLQLTTGLPDPAHNAGLIFWDDANRCPAFYDEVTGTSVQLSQEVPLWIYNASPTETLSNGKLCYLSGIHSDAQKTPTAGYANASDASTCLATMGFVTHDIPPETYGKLVRLGKISDLDTTAGSPAAGDVLWLSTTDGEFQLTEPGSPAYAITVGTMGYVHASEGYVQSKVDVGNNKQGTFRLINGSILEQHTTDVTADATEITLAIERTGGGDLSLFFDSEFSVVDTSPPATVLLTPGTDAVPVMNWVYIPKSTMVLTVSLTGWDTSQQIVPIGKFKCKTAVSTRDYGVYGHHAWTDHLANLVGQGHLFDLNNWVRNQWATWQGGSLISTTGGANTFDVACNAGTMLQLHEHITDAFDTATGSDIYVYNDNSTPYKRVSGGLPTEILDSTGTTMSGKYYNVVFWVVANEGTGNDKLMVNLPSGSYNTLSTAQTDLSLTATFDMPQDQKGTCMLLAKQVVQNSGGAGGTFTMHDWTNLRGKTPETAGSGGGGGGGTATWGDIIGTLSNQVDLQSALDLKANLAGPTFTGTTTIPTMAMGGQSVNDILISSDGASTSDTAVVTPGWIDANVGGGGGGNVVQNIGYTATVTPVWATGNIAIVAALTGNVTLANSVVDAVEGTYIEVRFIQDGTGGNSITLGSDYILLDGNAGYDTSPLAVTIFSGTARADGTIEGGFTPVDSDAPALVGQIGSLIDLNSYQGFDNSAPAIINWTAGAINSTGVVVSSANNRITVTVAGAYMCTACMNFKGDGGTTQDVDFSFFKNGTQYPFSGEAVENLNSAGEYKSITLTGLVDCASGDYLDVRGLGTNASSVALDASKGVFTVAKVA